MQLYDIQHPLPWLANMFVVVIINVIGLAMVGLAVLAKREQRKAARRLIKLGGSGPDAQLPPRRRHDVC